MNKLGLIIGIILGIIGIYKIDIVLIAGLNYFGKYVFFGLFHLFIVYLYYIFWIKFKGKLKVIMPVVLGLLIFSFSFILGA